MATQILVLDPNVPRDVIADLMLEDGSTYLVQAITSKAIGLFESADAPDISANASDSHVIKPPETWAIKVGADPIWMWGVGKIAVSKVNT